jgi:CDP-glucose 4,6-dehydratase
VAVWQSALEGLEMNLDFWRGMRVFLTGHTGFKGSWLSLWLQSMGAEITGYALAPNTEPNLFTLAKIADGMNSIIGDIRDLERLKAAVLAAKPDIIIHMAAQPLVRYSYDFPVETYATNVMGTVHLLEAFRASDTAKICINVTTDKCYENKEWHWGYRENEPMGGYDPYSNSKGCSELVTSAYRNSYFNPLHFNKHGKALASGRAGNVIGGGDWAADRLVPDIMMAFCRGKKVSIRNPHAIRPWQHVLEPLSGYLALAEQLWHKPVELAEGWNFGPIDGDCKAVGELVKLAAELWGKEASWQIANGDHPHEASFLKLDISKAKARLHWQPRWRLEEAVATTVEWYKVWHGRSSDLHQFTLQQLMRYSQAEV